MDYNYISIINHFWDSVTINPLSTGQVSLYFALLHKNNKDGWNEWFTAPNQVLSILTGLSRSGILKARNELKQRGYIDFKERGTKATLYKIITMSNSKQDSVQNSAQDGVQNSNTLYKQKQKLNTIPPLSPTRFNDFWQAYPKQENILAAEKAYTAVLFNDQSLTENDLVLAAANYAEAMKITGKEELFISYPENFLGKGKYMSYLPENYKKPVVKRSQIPQFNQFMQTDYDFEALEKELLSN